MRGYKIDKFDNIVGVTGDWDEFALSNGGKMAMSDKVVGRYLWSFVQGVSTQSYLNAMCFHVRRAQEPVEIGYRCDSPADFRRYRMVILPERNGGLHINSALIEQRTARRPAMAGLPLQGRMRQCSQCLSVEAGIGWQEASPGLATRPGVQVEVAVCPYCRHKAVQAISHRPADSRLLLSAAG